EQRVEPVDLAVIRARCNEEIAVETHYAGLEEHGIELGPALQAVRQLWRGEGEALAEIGLPASDAADTGSYGIHPALLDAAFQTLAATMRDADDAYLPMALERAQLIATPGMASWCHA